MKKMKLLRAVLLPVLLLFFLCIPATAADQSVQLIVPGCGP